MAQVTVYTQPGCRLCEEAVRLLTRLQAETPFTLEEVNIQHDPALLAEYGEQIPVVLLNGELLNGELLGKYTVDEDQVRARLKEVN